MRTVIGVVIAVVVSLGIWLVSRREEAVYPSDSGVRGESPQSRSVGAVAKPKAVTLSREATPPILESDATEPPIEELHLSPADDNLQRYAIDIARIELSSFKDARDQAALDMESGIASYLEFIAAERDVRLRELVIEALESRDGILLMNGKAISDNLQRQPGVRFHGVLERLGRRFDLFVPVASDAQLLDLSISVTQLTTQAIHDAVARFNALPENERLQQLQDGIPTLSLPTVAWNRITDEVKRDGSRLYVVTR